MSDQSIYNADNHKQKKSAGFLSSGVFKILVLIILILILLIPITMIRSLVYERSHRAEWAEGSIMEAWGSQFTIYGPVIRIPVVEMDYNRTTNKTLWIAPRDIDIQANFSAERKRRGIFSVALFSGNVSLKGSFTFDRAKDELKQNETLYPQQAEIIIGLSSQKGIRRVIKADWNGSELFFKPGGRNFMYDNTVSSGVNATSPFNTESINTFDIQFAVQGGKSMSTIPIAEVTRTRIISDWPSPSFQGGFLPTSYTLSETGFDAEWEISYLSRSIPLFWITSERGESNRINLNDEFFGVNFFKPLDHYALNERAVKYAILFIIIPFLTLFFLEIFSKKTIHPAQYLLSGLANIIFYLLLLSISEHIPFSFAYIISAAAITCMMSLYALSLLETRTRSAYMGIVMALLYLIMYLTLNAEDWALLIGSITAFLICAAVMFLTRKLDWNNLNIKNDAPKT
jgi:inner membrane protein